MKTKTFDKFWGHIRQVFMKLTFIRTFIDNSKAHWKRMREI